MATTILAYLYIIAKESDFKSFTLNRYRELFGGTDLETEIDFSQLISGGMLKREVSTEKKYSLTAAGMQETEKAFYSYWDVPLNTEVVDTNI
jgi:hypothetical protein